MKLHTEGAFHLWRTGAAETTLELNVATTKEFWVDFCRRPEANPKPCSSTQKFRVWTATDIWRWQSPSPLFCHHYNFEESPSETVLFKLVEKMWCIQQWLGPVLCNFCMVRKSVRLEWKSGCAPHGKSPLIKIYNARLKQRDLKVLKDIQTANGHANVLPLHKKRF